MRRAAPADVECGLDVFHTLVGHDWNRTRGADLRETIEITIVDRLLDQAHLIGVEAFTQRDRAVDVVGTVAVNADPYLVAKGFAQRANTLQVFVQAGADFHLEVREALTDQLADSLFELIGRLDSDHTHNIDAIT